MPLMPRLLVPAAALLGALALVAAPHTADAATLSIGDDAPSLDAEYWYGGGQPIERFEPGRIYVVEFWATWCKPCIENIPKLQALQKKHADRLSVVGVTVELPHEVEEFLAGTGLEGSLEYALAVDPDNSIFDDYMTATKRTTIPVVFLVGTSGRVEWAGHPKHADVVLERMLEGRWDPYAAEAWESTALGLERRLGAALEAQQLASALDLLDRLLEHCTSDAAAPSMTPADVTRYESLRAELLLGDGQFERGYSYARAFMTRHWDDATALNNLAWFVVDSPAVTQRDLALARTLAERAVELSAQRNAAYLDTLARVHFEQGDRDAALHWQQLAIDTLAPDDDATPFADALERYRTAAETGESRDDDAPADPAPALEPRPALH